MRDVKYLLVPCKIHFTALKIKVTVDVIDHGLVTGLIDHQDHEETVHHQDTVKDQESVNVKDLIVIVMIVNVIGYYFYLQLEKLCVLIILLFISGRYYNENYREGRESVRDRSRSRERDRNQVAEHYRDER